MTDTLPSETSPMGRVLIVAGSDPSGGAGIQADIKTVTMLGGYAAAALTALTVQNTTAVTDVLPMQPQFVADQMHAVLSDVGAESIKTGMLHNAEVMAAVADVIDSVKFGGDVVVDPVMVASSGAKLIDDSALETMRTVLVPRATVVTPNMPEAALLVGRPVKTFEDMTDAAKALIDMGASAAIVKGGHMEGNTLTDYVLTNSGGSMAITRGKIETRSTHGTGCSLASGIATGLAQGKRLDKAYEAAHEFVRQAIRLAPGLGAGHGPLGHARVPR
ncbi:MAG: bifunctional hydroxymethylpyrimidine kinase/phosphomethylpyrimidine kinase [Kordiimonadaceae bacterium]|nr:bifunctional hydroxymethylpyrimidine kinase/phosphomethylpyrimidine kinase [Kordiimonadaceae bacterium]MBO6569104.1 bifunctional hydroxymethylpyrimidine kinase/phosphomethylpyrimidine kinase [Kordiimonadaceae bacterium]MBO6964579.1 bifunctional hydroxymethylpyrimidine kinase/phosphomethylpyrimidine kinase [Kordiimonadaceae bacterium]